jgi:hemolysin activation/secretion protein
MNFFNKQCRLPQKFKLLSGVMLACWASAALAQVTPPDAGSLSATPLTPPASPPKSPVFDIQQQIRPALAAPGGVKVKALSFKISGNTVFSEAVLTDLLAPYIGQDLDLAGLDQAADAISRYYRAQGYFVARAYLPEQEVASGNLEIAVIEGRVGAVKINPDTATRLTKDRAESLIANSVVSGAAVREQNIERALMLLNDLPGVSVKSTLIPGATPSTSDLVFETTEGGLLGGGIDADNFGNKNTGVARVGVTANLNDPLGLGDQLVVRALTTGQGLKHSRVAFNAPVGDMGTKLGLALSKLDYRLTKDLVALNANGQSTVGSLFVVHPLVRSRNNNLYGTVTYDSKRLTDNQLGINAASKKIGVYGLGLSGDVRDGLGGGGLTAGSLTLARGTLDLAGNANHAANDALTASTAGAYSKVNYNASRLQRLGDEWSVYANFTGQSAAKNLDSSEKFALGGMGVRAYPQGEASGDAGALLNLEARYNIPGFEFGNLQLVGFYDYGSIKLHKTTWAGWQPIGLPNFPNSYSLSGAGFGLNVYKENDFSVRSSVAWKVGSNPGRDALGRDSDSESKSLRFWLQLSKQF